MITKLSQEPTTQEEVEIKTKIDETLAELKRLNAEMARDRADFVRLAEETKELRTESHMIMAKTQEMLAALEAA